MKKIIFILVSALFLAQYANAEFVKPERAAQYAKGALGMKETPEPENTSSLRAQGRNGNAEPEYYVFNNPQGGWVIIAADDRINPVIGYSDNGSFSISDMPESVQWWMDGVAQTVNAVRESGLEIPSSAWSSPAIMSAGAPASVKDSLETAKWSQSEPYNNMCPVANGENMRSVTGCVATAMSIIMRYNRWPEHGKGVIGGYTTLSYPTYIPPYAIDDHVYDWDEMPLSDGSHPNSKWTPENRKQVAQLMHDCGVAVKMDYTSEGSGTLSNLVTNAFQENMSFSDKAALVSRSSYTRDDWFSLLRNEIDQRRVVYYAADSEGGGHAFVCDGYDTDGQQIRINWGWGGYYNGYYALNLEVSEMGLAFSNSQVAIIGLAPDTTSVEVKETAKIICNQVNGFYGIEPLVPADITEGGEFSFYVGWLMNNENRDVTREFKICLEDKNGTVKQEGWHLSIDFPASNGYLYSNETEKTTLTVSPELTDIFRLYYKDDQGEWHPMQGNYDLLPDVEGIICGVIQDPLIILPDDCVAGKDIKLILSLGFTHVKSVKWNVNGEELEEDACQLKSGKNSIRADVEYLDGSKGSIYRTIQLE